MYFDSIGAAVAMDGHGIFVWSAYAIAAVAIAVLIVLPRRRERRLLRELAGQLRRQKAQSAIKEGEQ